MLTDHRILQERQVGAARRRRRCVRLWGKWIEDLANWSWFLTITFRQTCLREHARVMEELDNYFLEIQQAAGRLISWVFAQERGHLGDRFHIHALVSGVDALSIATWRMIAFHRFGLSDIKRFRAGIGAGNYIAKNVVDEPAGLHFGGTLASKARMANRPKVGRRVVVPSANVPSEFFRLTLGRRRRR
jgi:hypothetical protein